MDIKKEDNVDFINLVLMLNQNALISLGEALTLIGIGSICNISSGSRITVGQVLI